MTSRILIMYGKPEDEMLHTQNSHQCEDPMCSGWAMKTEEEEYNQAVAPSF